MCESFNSTIVDAREKPIVSMLTEIRLAAMERLAAHKILSDKWINEWSPTCMQKYQDNMEAAFGCRVFFNGAYGYEIVDGDDRHNVFLDKQLCTCKAWELSGIPCSHAICAIRHSKQDPKRFISHWYHKTAYGATYEVVMQPMPGKEFMDCDAFDKLQPPPIEMMTGRPRK
ncbi:hypothetical protein C2S52_002401 [Perilla frutescens var. hirtella]|nr:hypothetical protein C2S52_002401 [Perilla frutescens var. hirtella]